MNDHQNKPPTPGPSWAALDGECDITLARDLAAPRMLVWQAMTDPQQVSRWWGPDGFTTRTIEMDLRPGGRWVHIMHGPDGIQYPNTAAFTLVDPPHKLAFTNSGGARGGRQVTFNSQWTFEELAANRTRVRVRMKFASAAERDHVIKEHGALEGGKQALARLDAWVADVTGSRYREVVIARHYAAPPATVFCAWVTPEILRQWWGPQGFSNPVCEADLRVGGHWRIVMQAPDRREYPCGGEYLEIEPSRRLVFTNNALDASGATILQGLTTVTFEAVNGGTKLTLTTQAVAMVEFAADYLKGMQAGWSQSLERLLIVVGN